MQVDPIKPTLKAPGTNRLTLTYDVTLSNFAPRLNLRRYIKDAVRDGLRAVKNVLTDKAVVAGAGAFEAEPLSPYNRPISVHLSRAER